MILPGFPVLFSSGIVFPEVTVTRANIGGGNFAYGFIMSGGYTAGAFGASGGSLSGTLVPGFDTDCVIGIPSEGGITVSITGNCAAMLSGVTALMDNGTPLSLSAPFAYDSANNITFAETSSGAWSTTGNRTVQLV